MRVRGRVLPNILRGLCLLERRYPRSGAIRPIEFGMNVPFSVRDEMVFGHGNCGTLLV